MNLFKYAVRGVLLESSFLLPLRYKKIHSTYVMSWQFVWGFSIRFISNFVGMHHMYRQCDTVDGRNPKQPPGICINLVTNGISTTSPSTGWVNAGFLVAINSIHCTWYIRGFISRSFRPSTLREFGAYKVGPRPDRQKGPMLPLEMAWK